MRAALFALLMCAPLALWAEEAATVPNAETTMPNAEPVKKADWGWAFLGALEMGGDAVARVYFTDGSTQDVKAGQGGTFGVGVRYRPYPDAPWGVRSTLGYKFVTTKADNVDIGIDRWVWDLVVNRRLTENGWVGAGLVRHMNIEFDSGGLGQDMSFDDALGMRLEAGWRWIALSYTRMEYQDEFGFTYDANSLGVVLTNAF